MALGALPCASRSKVCSCLWASDILYISNKLTLDRNRVKPTVLIAMMVIQFDDDSGGFEDAEVVVGGSSGAFGVVGVWGIDAVSSGISGGRAGATSEAWGDGASSSAASGVPALSATLGGGTSS